MWRKAAACSCRGAEPTETTLSSQVQFESSYGSRGLLGDSFLPCPLTLQQLKIILKQASSNTKFVKQAQTLNVSFLVNANTIISP